MSDMTFSWQRHKVLLASSSPRRRELLAQIGVSFSQIRADIDESSLANEDARQYVTRIARSKADAANNQRALDDRDVPLISADTCVTFDDRIYGKPCDKQHALQMLQSLSGGKHQVMTKVCCLHQAERFEAFSVTDVWFRDLSLEEIEAYWATGEPIGKAGAYALQGLAASFISRIEGSYSGVIGLPLFETSQMLQQVFEK